MTSEKHVSAEDTPPQAPGLHQLSGSDFFALVAEGTRYVERYADAINALNVFPVPDGDTGTNMRLTLRAALESQDHPLDGPGTVAQVSATLARGAIFGGRGNSGVILSQFLKGLSGGLSSCDELSGADLSQALKVASVASYRAVSNPVEGTMLTVIGAAAASTPFKTDSVVDVLQAAHEAAEAALARTPEQLPILREAGVVDAGGQGVVAFLAGALAFASGKEVALEITAPAGNLSDAGVSHEFLEHTKDEQYGFCIQFVIESESLDVDAMRQQMATLATSTVVVGDDRLVRVHVHATDPGPLISLAVALGSVDQVSIQNMDRQHQEFMALQARREDRPGLAVVAVAPGEGFSRIFRDLGAATVVRGGPTMNPSVAQLLDGVGAADAEHVIILPNDANIVLAAQQAAGLSDGGLTVAPSSNVAQGIAAMLAFKPDLDLASNLAAMTSAMAEVQAGEVTTAVRSTSIGGIKVEAGQFIALFNGELTAVGESANAVLVEMLHGAEIMEGSLITLYFSGANSEASAAEAAAQIQATFTEVEVEVLEGGQPYSHYLVSIE